MKNNFPSIQKKYLMEKEIFFDLEKYLIEKLFLISNLKTIWLKYYFSVIEKYLMGGKIFNRKTTLDLKIIYN